MTMNTMNYVFADQIVPNAADIVETKVYPISTLYSKFHLPAIDSPVFQTELINGISQLKQQFMAEIEEKGLIGVDTPELEMYIELRQRVLPAEATGGKLVNIEKEYDYFTAYKPG